MYTHHEKASGQEGGKRKNGTASGAKRIWREAQAHQQKRTCYRRGRASGIPSSFPVDGRLQCCPFRAGDCGGVPGTGVESSVLSARPPSCACCCSTEGNSGAIFLDDVTGLPTTVLAKSSIPLLRCYRKGATRQRRVCQRSCFSSLHGMRLV